MSEELNKAIEKLRKKQKTKNAGYNVLGGTLGSLLALETVCHLYEDVAEYKTCKKEISEKPDPITIDENGVLTKESENNPANYKNAEIVYSKRRLLIRTVKHGLTGLSLGVSILRGIQALKDINDVKTGKEISKTIAESKKKEKSEK